MEPEVHIIEKYFQLVLGCFTMTNIQCRSGKEIDLLAMNPKTGEKFHVESRIVTSPSFALRLKDTYTLKGRHHRRGLDYISRRKFNHKAVIEKINQLWGDSKYRKILVTWGIHSDVIVLADSKRMYDIEVYYMEDFIKRLIAAVAERGIKGSRDDVIRIYELLIQSLRDENRRKKRHKKRVEEIIRELEQKKE